MSVSGRYPFIPLLGISVREVSASPLLLPPRRIPPAFSLFVATYRYTVTENQLGQPVCLTVPPVLQDVGDALIYFRSGLVRQSGIYNPLVQA